MRSDIRPMAESFTTEHRNKRLWQRVFTVLAAVVVFCTTYALILPAITWERSLVCDLPEHIHMDECYETALTDVHELVCGKAEHVHNSACYEKAEKLVCSDWTHVHDDSCYETEYILVCNTEEHSHTDDCYRDVQRIVPRLICGLESHIHTDACYDAPPAQLYDCYYCGLDEHIHDESCYFDDGTLCCTLPEHVHTIACRSNREADLENARYWEKAFIDLKLTGNWNEDVIAVAETQLGYCESRENFEAVETELKGYTRYGEWYGMPYGDWCAMFCSFCINYAEVKDFPVDCECQRWTEKLDELDLYHPADTGDYTPRPGDLVFFDWDEYTEETRDERTADHVAFVYEIIPSDGYSSAKIRTIDGNWDDCVCYAERELDSDIIIGYGEMPVNPKLAEKTKLDYFGINVSCDSGYIYLNPEFGDINTAAYEWQWQYSENAGEPWKNIVNENEEDLSLRVINCAQNAGRFYRIIGTAKSDSDIVLSDSSLLFAESNAFSADDVFEVSQPSVIVSGAATPMLTEGAARVRYYWKPVTSSSELTADGVYIITTKGDNGGIALSGTSVSAGTSADMAAAGGRNGYYTTALDEEYWWKVGTDGETGYLQNIGTNYYLSIGSNGELSSDAEILTYTYLPETDSWIISNGTAYLNFDGTGFAASSDYIPLTVYRQEIASLPRLAASPSYNASIKPTYPEYIDVSGSENGDTQQNGIPGEYWSDPSTSQLESLFSGISADDGKLVTDKSVIYGHDDYDAFANYDPNIFGVTLSALGQTYSLNDEFDIKTPLDVVFIIDCSGSMTDNKENNVPVANIATEALNISMAQVLDMDPDNRVGVVCFSGQSEELLPLGRYSANNSTNSFFNFTYNTENIRYSTLKPSTSLSRTDGQQLESNSWEEYWGGTFTQEGIAEGAGTFLDVDETTVTRTVTKLTDDGVLSATYTVPRKPVFILLSDGEPTYCTEEYDNVEAHNHIYGSGNSGYNNGDATNGLSWLADTTINNNQGVQGYYTILSANYYKNKVSEHYRTDAFFYTFGLSIYDEGTNGNNSYSLSASGDDYKRAILNPTAANIQHLLTCVSGRNNGDAPARILSNSTYDYRNISPLTDATCRELYILLNGDYEADNSSYFTNNRDSSNRPITDYFKHDGSGNYYVRVGSVTQQQYLHGLRHTSTTDAPLIHNPYAGNYNYADGSYFISTANTQELVSSFMESLEVSSSLPVYGFILKNNTPLEISDTIGEGMEIKSAPVLRYNGENYLPSGEPSVDGNVTTYHYEGISVAKDISGNPDGSGHSTDISEIYAEVVNENGTQTVKLIVPDSLAPAYMPSLDAQGNANFYFEQLPVRLIYQVGLTNESQTDVAALAGTGNSLTYYTNAWTGSDYTYSDYQPTSYNPYYDENTYDRSSLLKEENTTNTNSYAMSYDSDSDADYVSQHLGNNGKLTFTSEYYETVPVVIHKTELDGTPITTDTAVFEVFSDADLTVSIGQYETDAVTGTVTIPGLRTDRTYYIKEIRAPEGYEPFVGAKAFTVDENGEITGFTADEFFNVIDGEIFIYNDFGHVSRSAEKHWAGTLPDGESYPASVQFQLYADGEEYGLPVTLNAGNEWRYTWSNLPSVSLTDRHLIEYSVQEIQVEGYVPQTEILDDGTTVITNQKINPTSLSVLKKWEGGTGDEIQVELLKNGDTTGSYATLDEDNGWYYMWDDLPDYDENGPIEYSVREFAVDGYDSDVHLWTGPGDPYGQTAGDPVLSRVSSFEDDKDYILTFYLNGTNYNNGILDVLMSDTDKQGLYNQRFNQNAEVIDRMLWHTSVSGSNITFTNVYAGKMLVLINDSGYKIALGTSGLATSWTFYNDGSGYTLRTRYNGTNYNYNITSTSGGTGNASTSSWRYVYPYVYESGIVEDDVEKGDIHYIIKNTHQTNPPSDLTLSFTKVDSDDDSTLTGAVFELYLETGLEEDSLIPGTTDRFGVPYVQQWTSDGNAKTVNVDRNGRYYLVEVSPPDGYQPLTEPIVFDVTSDGGGTRTASIVYHPEISGGTGFTDMDIPNTLFDTYALPETGGTGIIPVYGAGLMLSLFAAAVLLLSRRKRETENS